MIEAGWRPPRPADLTILVPCPVLRNLARIMLGLKGDQARDVGPLAKAEDATEVITDDMSHEEVLVHLEWVVRSHASPE